MLKNLTHENEDSMKIRISYEQKLVVHSPAIAMLVKNTGWVSFSMFFTARFTLVVWWMFGGVSPFEKNLQQKSPWKLMFFFF